MDKSIFFYSLICLNLICPKSKPKNARVLNASKLVFQFDVFNIMK